MTTIREMLDFAATFVGTPYRWWTPETDMTRSPFFAIDKEIDAIESIHAIACTGLLNLIYRRFGLPVPGTDTEYPGGTWAWHRALKKTLQRFDASKTYPEGTLLLTPYVDDIDQGHVAIVYRETDTGNVFDSLIIHAWSGPGVAVESLGYSHFSFDPEHRGYYRYACRPENWLIH